MNGSLFIGPDINRDLVRQSFLRKVGEEKSSIMRNIIRNIVVIYVGRRNMKTKKIEVVKDRWSDGVALEISHNGWQPTCIIDLDLEDLKKLRKVIRKAIREYENNKPV